MLAELQTPAISGRNRQLDLGHRTDAVQNIINAFLLVYAALFPIVNPIGSAPLFLRMTCGRSAAERSVLALNVAFNSFFLLLGSLFIGSHVLEFFGITLLSCASRRHGGCGIRVATAACSGGALTQIARRSIRQARPSMRSIR
jgi:small neutral amino acid transporter SnatA (MarC family)